MLHVPHYRQITKFPRVWGIPWGTRHLFGAGTFTRLLNPSVFGTEYLEQLKIPPHSSQVGLLAFEFRFLAVSKDQERQNIFLYYYVLSTTRIK